MRIIVNFYLYMWSKATVLNLEKMLQLIKIDLLIPFQNREIILQINTTLKILNLDIKPPSKANDIVCLLYWLMVNDYFNSCIK